MKINAIFRNILALILSCYFLSSCGEYPTCVQHGKERPCTFKEIKVMEKVQEFIEQIANFDENDFLIESSNHSPARVHLLGERHTDIKGKLNILGYINHYGKKGDVVLEEGLSRKKPYFEYPVITTFAQLYGAHICVNIQSPYEPSLWDKCVAENFPFKEVLYTLLGNNYELSKIKHLFVLKFAFWDKKNIGELDFSSLASRNKTMTKAIAQHLNPLSKNKIFVDAGYRHLPFGEKVHLGYLNKNQNVDIPDSYDGIYSVIEKNRRLPIALRNLKIDTLMGSTKVIYDYLTKEQISYKQAIPKSSLIKE